MPRRSIDAILLTSEGELVEAKKLVQLGPGPTYYLAIPKGWLDLWSEPIGEDIWIEWIFEGNKLIITPIGPDKVKSLKEFLK